MRYEWDLHYLIKRLGSFWGFTSDMPERGHHHDGAVEDWRICLLSVGPSSFRLFVLPVVMKSGSIKKSPPFLQRVGIFLLNSWVDKFTLKNELSQTSWGFIFPTKSLLLSTACGTTVGHSGARMVCSLYSNNSLTPQCCRIVVFQRKKAVYFIPLSSPGSLSVAIQPLFVNIFRSSFH